MIAFSRSARLALLSAVTASPMAGAASATGPEEVVVTATRTAQPVSADLAPTTVVDREDIENSNAESVQDILQQQSKYLPVKFHF